MAKKSKVRTRQRKSGSWSYAFEGAKIDGKRNTIEKGGFATEEEAYNEGVKAYQEYHEAGMVFKPSESSVADYLDWWVDNVGNVNVRPNTIANYRKMIRCHLKPDLGGYFLKSLSPAVIDAWVIGKWKQYHYAHGTIDNMLKVLKVALDYAVYPGKFIKENPARYIKAPNEAKSASRKRPVLSTEDVKKILNRFPFGNSYHIPILLGFHTSFRIAEVLGLCWEDVDLDAGVITLKQQIQRITGSGKHGAAGKNTGIYHICPVKTKASERTIKIGPTLIKELRAWRERQKENARLFAGDYRKNYVSYEFEEKYTKQFINRVKTYAAADKITLPTVDFVCTQECGDFVRANSFSSAARIARVELGVDNFDFHSLRHTHATLLIEGGAKIKDVSQRLGHASVETTLDTYTRDTEAMQNETVDMFERLIQKNK